MSLPYSLNAEKAVLGAMMVSSEALVTCVALLVEDDFYLKEHKIIFRTIKNVNDKRVKVDIVTVSEQLVVDGLSDKLSRPEYIYELAEEVVSPSNAEHYLKIVKDQTTLRNLVISATNIVNNWKKEDMGDINSYAAKIEKEILSITRARAVGGFQSTEEVLKVLKEKLFNISKNRGELSGVTSGFKDLDKITHGFQKGDLIILAARPSMGKTALALNFAMNAAAKTDKTIGIFSLEMPSNQLLQRMLSASSNVNSSKIRSLSLNENEWTKIDVAISSLSSMKIFVDDTAAARLVDIQAKARKLKSVHDDLGLIIVDYLQLITTPIGTKGDSRQLEVAEISRGLKEMARELKVPVIALSQLSRAVEKRVDKRPMLSDLRESGSIEQDADLVMFIYREEYYQTDKEKEDSHSAAIVELNIAKHRNGPTGDIELVFLREYGLFSGKARE